VVIANTPEDLVHPEVLVVEDESTSRRALVALLMKAGFPSIQARRRCG